MKGFTLWLPLFLASVTAAQYFSEGWKPGQAATEQPVAAAPSYVPGNPPPSSGNTPPSGRGGGLASLYDLFDISKLLKSEPVTSLFARAGVNITENLERMESVKLWDDRVQLITDDNFHELIVNETLSEDEEEDRIWAIIISATSSKQGGVSKFFDENFDLAYNNTLIADDLPHVRWGRIDYLNVTYLTTKWGVWQAPSIVILKHRGQTLRFYRPHELRMRDGAIRDFLLADAWKQTSPWKTEWAPGGSREYIMDFVAIWLTKVYNITLMVPRWILYLLSGTVASLFISFLHKTTGVKQGPPPAVKRAAPANANADPNAAPLTPAASAPQAVAEPTPKGESRKRKSRR